MYPQSHFLFAFFLSQILVQLNVLTHTQAIITAVIAVLIDLDHLIEYGVHDKDWNPKHAWNSAVVEHNITERTFIHHKPGFIFMTILSVILYLINIKIFWIVAIAYYSHMFLDYVNLDFLKIKRTIKIKEAGFSVYLRVHELIFDIMLILGILVLIL